MFCLNKNLIGDFLDKLKSGEIDPQKLSTMSSEQRHDFFAEFLGEANAKEVNALFESKLLLKDQQQGIINWARTVAGIKPEAKRDIISRVNKMTQVLNPKNEKEFLADLAAHKLGATVSMAEASHISDLARTISENKTKIAPNSEIQSDERLNYGRALVKFNDYVGDLKNKTKKLTVEDLKINPLGAVGKVASNAAGLAKSLKASLDNSAIGRQGLKVLFSHPEIWVKNASQSFVDIAKVFGGKEVLNEVKADVLSRPNALNGLYSKEKLAVGVTEEAYPTNLPEKIPGLGRAFKASEEAFTAFQYRTRADVFDKYLEIAQKSGEQNYEGIGKIANSLTGRGNIGTLEPVANTVNNIFFSPRFLKSNFDLLAIHAADSGISGFARREAAYNLVKVIGGIAAVLAIADQVMPGSVEKDSRSADFGKIRVGNTRFDVSAGISGLITLASRLITRSTKSSKSGKVSNLDSGKFGQPTAVDVVVNFFENKLSPAAAFVKDILNGRDWGGNKINATGVLSNLLLPLPINTYLELKNNPNAANIILAMIMDEIGISTNTY